jgi:hypothetical protein
LPKAEGGFAPDVCFVCWLVVTICDNLSVHSFLGEHAFPLERTTRGSVELLEFIA